MAEILGNLDDGGGGEEILVGDEKVKEGAMGFVVDGFFADSDAVKGEDNPVRVLNSLTSDLNELGSAEVGWINDFEVFGRWGGDRVDSGGSGSNRGVVELQGGKIVAGIGALG